MNVHRLRLTKLSACLFFRHKELQQLLTDFGTAKLECDREGIDTEYVFPNYEYKAWNMMCPEPKPASDGTTPARQREDSKEKTPAKPTEDGREERTPVKPTEDSGEERASVKPTDDIREETIFSKPTGDARDETRKKQKRKRKGKKDGQDKIQEERGERENTELSPDFGESCNEKLDSTVHRIRKWLAKRTALEEPESCR